MKLKIGNLVRQNIRELKPYTSARSLYSGGEATLLDANENGDDPFGEGLNRYPDPLQKELKKEISKIKKVAPENIFLGNGSDEAIEATAPPAPNATSVIGRAQQVVPSSVNPTAENTLAPAPPCVFSASFSIRT